VSDQYLDDEEPSGPVFLDRTGRRWPRVRRFATLVGAATTLFFLSLTAILLLAPPALPTFHPAAQSVAPRFTGVRQNRLRRTKREELYAALQVQTTARSIRRAAAAIERELTGVPNTRQIRAGFYVWWADNSLASFQRNYDDLDWIISEWGYLSPGGDSVDVSMIQKDTSFFGVYDSIPSHPKVFLLINNVDRKTQQFTAAGVTEMLGTPALRTKVEGEILAAVLHYKFAGVTIDFENAPPGMTGNFVQFDSDLGAMLHSHGLLLTQTVGVNTAPEDLKAYSAVNDYLFLMLYDEHYGKGDPGPVASQGWYVQRAREMLRSVPAKKAIFALGAYGYDWNDAGPANSGDAYTFQEVLAKGRDNPGSSRMGFDKESLNPYMTWTDPDSTDHLVWYLDGASAYNQVRAERALGGAGYAVWRLGAEDPALWKAVATDKASDAAAVLSEIPAGYETEFIGDGEILQIVASPRGGSRVVTADTTRGVITGERIVAYPSPYIVRKYGESKHEIALTFDDGPDGTWTGPILDTLKSRGVTATFFVIGRNVEAHIPLMRRIVREGNLFGNHTFTHPNLAITPDWVTKLEIDANQRLLEAILDRRSFFFRPPYFGDAEPTTTDELVPVDIASKRGYVTVGLHIDAEDWQPISAEQIIKNVMDQRYYGGVMTSGGLRAGGNVILLHDGGGNRAQTVRALGPIIDSLRAHGDTIVPLSELAGISKDDAIPPLPPRSALTREIELATFSFFSGLEWGLYWLFFIAVVVGAIRLVVIIALATYQRYHSRKPKPVYTPSVTIIVPAYNEERVIVSTVLSLLTQEYGGDLNIIVVDDGSPDETFNVVTREFGDDPRVTSFRKENGGKASALNFGIARARGEIIVCLDADTQFTPSTVTNLVAPMHDPKVGAVAGNAKVGNRHNMVTRWQALEYVTSQNLERRAFAVLNAITIVPGAVGAWRKAYVQAVGGFSDDTLAEDQDLTWALGEEGVRVTYADDAIAYTEAPDTLRTLIRQRFRWSFGTLQSVWKHKKITFRPKYGALGMIAMPNVWVFQLFYTAISPLADMLFAWSLASVVIARYQHGDRYALSNLEDVLKLYVIFLVVDWLAAVVAFLMEPGEEKALTWLVLIQRFVFRQTMYWVVVRSIAAALRGHVVGWGKLERKGMTLLPTTAHASAPAAASVPPPGTAA
jgi:cellulose synthase/poly-beta-1,6-N-acetylglucosamine synthase-like glycosyltransferase/peptidoglycan/xylan/chitin deacetylase (PgdA/CDA1 family)/spore germination protein YaaH